LKFSSKCFITLLKAKNVQLSIVLWTNLAINLISMDFLMVIFKNRKNSPGFDSFWEQYTILWNISTNLMIKFFHMRGIELVIHAAVCQTMFFDRLNRPESIVENQIIVFHAHFCENAAEAVKFAVDDKRYFRRNLGAQGLVNQKIREAFGAKPRFLIVQAAAEEFGNGGRHDQSRYVHKLQVQVHVVLEMASHFDGHSSLVFFGEIDCWLNLVFRIRLSLKIYYVHW